MGGGHGLAASLSALRYLPGEITAIVTVADNGGSSGRLRDELGVLPPGDLRQALAALCGDDEWGRTWAQVLQHRFDSTGELGGHAVGNLLIVSLWELLGDHVDGLDWIGRLLGARGRVLPMSSIPLDIEATVRQTDGSVDVVRGQAEVATTAGDVMSVRLDPTDPPASLPALQAVRDADWVVVGPGSWFTSVIPNLLVPDLSRALHETSARRMLVLNLEAQTGETEGFSPERHLEVIGAHAPDLHVDVVLADRDAVDDATKLSAAAKDLGAELVLDEVARGGGSAQHDPLRLAAAYERIMRPPA
ncbi:gluconeogenesis factor YvcK family protein [Mumia sp. Pv 4-285]|uniref:gluconeogenesis factor YvcK family protein n=1 Tax=Mumia qirimensis TaxID=3234852 RepID=UPI00351D7576